MFFPKVVSGPPRVSRGDDVVQVSKSLRSKISPQYWQVFFCSRLKNVCWRRVNFHFLFSGQNGSYISASRMTRGNAGCGNENGRGMDSSCGGASAENGRATRESSACGNEPSSPAADDDLPPCP